MSKVRKLFSVILLFVIILGYVVLFSYRTIAFHHIFGYKDLEVSFGIIKAILLSIFTIIGILSKIIYDEIEKTSDDNFSIWNVTLKAVNSRQSWMALITCPIVILAFYKSLYNIDSNALICLLSFQNGFFFKSVFNKKDEKAPKSPPVKK